jgi:hypothetical protein
MKKTIGRTRDEGLAALPLAEHCGAYPDRMLRGKILTKFPRSGQLL